jgi:NADH-quinone oxidoreductase subunit E
VERVRELAHACAEEGRGLIPLLQDIQAEYNYLPPDSLRIVAEELKVPLSQVYSVANFYHSFSLTPRGKHTILACLGTACHVRGAPRVVDAIAKRLGVEPGGTTEDLLFTLETVNCVGACALGPVVTVGGVYHHHMTAAKAAHLVDQLAKRERGEEVPAR